MTTMALEKPDGGLGSCQAAAAPRLADSWSHDSQEPEAEGSPAGKVDTRPKKTEKESVAKGAPGSGKERPKAGATPRSPARKKAQAAPPPQPPPPPPALSEELPWGDVSLNKCLVLASLVALLGSAFQLCRDMVIGGADAPAPAPAPAPWVPPSSAPKKPSPPLKPEAWTPPPGPAAPPVPAEETEAPGSAEAAGKEAGDPEEAAGGERAPLAHEGPQGRPQKERPRRERPRKERPRTEERPWKPEKPRPAREPREPPPQRGKAREEGHRPWERDSGEAKHRKRQAWASPRRPSAEDWPPGRRKHRAGKGCD